MSWGLLFEGWFCIWTNSRKSLAMRRDCKVFDISILEEHKSDISMKRFLTSRQTMFLFYMILGVRNGEGIQPILRNCQARMRVLSKNLGLWESTRMNTSLSYILTETLMALKGELRACLGIPNGLGIVTLGNKRCK